MVVGYLKDVGGTPTRDTVEVFPTTNGEINVTLVDFHADDTVNSPNISVSYESQPSDPTLNRSITRKIKIKDEEHKAPIRSLNVGTLTTLMESMSRGQERDFIIP